MWSLWSQVTEVGGGLICSLRMGLTVASLGVDELTIATVMSGEMAGTSSFTRVDGMESRIQVELDISVVKLDSTNGDTGEKWERG